MVTAVGNTTTAAAANYGPTTAETTTTGGDFETFLRMLTTQIQNQDPLNPMESTEFAVQLATFSGVEQQAHTNALLTELVLGAGGGQLSQLSEWIGRDVRSTAPSWYDGDPLTLQIDPDANADQVTLVILDENGREVGREDIGTGSGEVDWQGRSADGAPLADGLYRFQLESVQDGKVIALTDVSAFSKVTGVDLTANGTVLRLEGGSTVGLEGVTAVRS
ncbi:flagellar hook capping FlgD N-terminal domain-containing protein [Paracoccus laeviglucosivorans]|uniref:Basal-body rod modification protein FlgD n=1 Tax=Paracoccus laeviglucosivorans TaxID=1197861 RepID=A0A521F920_9RHOB|nr:flagellar hook capping FlgD N-terminal domain-containing protein [Paracoccus laeviglucosivorans]SMO92111.1 flagellar basal-body rod modification protein FlgD [Paracoccus laeviglucosivorans]